MSQMTATARPLRSGARQGRRAIAPPPLRVIPARVQTTGGAGFVGLCAGLLLVGLICLLLLNTALAQGAMGLSKLQRESSNLRVQTSSLEQRINDASSAGNLAQAASELGMVRSAGRGYIDLSTGKITGKAVPAGPNEALTIIKSSSKAKIPTPLAVASADVDALARAAAKAKVPAPKKAPAATSKPKATPANAASAKVAVPTTPAATPKATGAAKPTP